MHGQLLLDRRITQTGFRTALVRDGQSDLTSAWLRGDRHVRLHFANEHHLLAEIVVVPRLAARNVGLPELCGPVGRDDLHLVAIEVVAVGDVPAQRDAVRAVARSREYEGLVRREEVAFGLRPARKDSLEVETLAASAAGRCSGRRSRILRCHIDAARPSLRRVAQPGVRAALELEGQVKGSRRPVEPELRGQSDRAAIDDLLAEVLVLVVFADGETRCTDRDTGGRGFQPEAVPVEVVAGLDVDSDHDVALRGLHRVLVGLLWRKERVLGLGDAEREPWQDEQCDPSRELEDHSWHASGIPGRLGAPTEVDIMPARRTQGDHLGRRIHSGHLVASVACATGWQRCRGMSAGVKIRQSMF